MNPLLEDTLVCTKCRGKLEQKRTFLICRSCGLAFPVLKRTVPVMLLEEAWPLSTAEKHGFTHQLKL